MAIWNNEHGSTLQRRIGIFMDAIVPELNFITIHYAYFIVVILLVATVFWGAATPFRSVSFTDALFLTTSAMTEVSLPSWTILIDKCANRPDCRLVSIQSTSLRSIHSNRFCCFV